MKNYQWQPGNGSNYDIDVVEHDGKVLLCWMLKGGSGGEVLRFERGVCIKFERGSFLARSYLAEKMALDEPGDIAAILALVHKLGLADVGMPEGYGLDGLMNEGYVLKFTCSPISDEDGVLDDEAVDEWAEKAGAAVDSLKKSPRDYTSQPSASALEALAGSSGKDDE